MASYWVIGKEIKKRLPLNHIDETSLSVKTQEDHIYCFKGWLLCAYVYSCKISYYGHVKYLQDIYLGLQTVLAGKQSKTKYLFQFSHSVVSSSLWPHGLPAHQASMSITNSQSLLKLMSIESVIPSNHLILCCPLHLLPSIFPSIRVFSNETVLRIRWLKFWSFSLSISPSNEYSELISFRIDWFDLLEVQGTLKSLLYHHSSKASILWCSIFFIVHLSHPHMTTGKTVALTRWTFVGKVMSLLFNMLSRLVIAFLLRSKCLLISWLQLPSTWFWAEENKVCYCFHCFPIYLPWSDGTRCHNLSFLNVGYLLTHNEFTYFW